MLKLCDVSKTYGKNEIIKNISYEFKDKGLYVLSGINGSGKSTLIKLLSNFIYKNKGQIICDDQISMLPEKFSFPPLVSSFSYLKIVLALNGVNENPSSLLEKYQIPNQKIYCLSKGNKQKLGILQAIYTNAKIIILDEPIDGLDDTAKKIFKDDIKNLSKNKLIIVSLHVKSFFNDINCINLEIKDGGLVEKKKRKKPSSTV